MRSKLRRVWPIVKALLWILILYFIGRQFVRDLQKTPKLEEGPLSVGWLVLSGILYELGFGFSALYWQRLLGHLGAPIPLGTALRAWYIGQLGKYVPGKAWALFMRTSLVHGHGVGVGLAVLTAFYEVVTTMAAGVLLAAVLFAVFGVAGEAGDTTAGAGPSVETLRQLLSMEHPGEGGLERSVVVLISALMFMALLLPLQPSIFNRLALRGMGEKRDQAGRLPRIRFVYLLEGLALAMGGWLFLGAGVAAALRGIVGPEWPLFDVRTARLPAIMGLSYVVGFVILIAPGGIGPREFMLTLLLTPELVGIKGMGSEDARAAVVLTVLVMRLTWTIAELVTASICWLTGRAAASQSASRPTPQAPD